MIDKFTTMFSTLMVLFVIIRAARLDRILPWFETRWQQEQRMKTAAGARKGGAPGGDRPAGG
ncbi:MAG: hypothetical protein KGL55_15595, partial [Rhodospirillales bacterium]|nr:hypothetical protein [Rhodospirillales bacterium]